MTIEAFIDKTAHAGSPIEDDGCSTSELDMTQTLSLPESFDESLCLDLYKELKGQGQPSSSSPSPRTSAPLSDNASKPPEIASSQQDGLELKVRELLAANLRLTEKNRLFDNLKKRSAKEGAELEGLREQTQHQVVREKELQRELLDHKRKAHLTSIDLEHAEKENEILLSRAEKAEDDCEASADALKRAEQKCTDALTRLESEREERKEEAARLREDHKKETSAQRDHQAKAFARESKLLCDARDQALEQAQLLRQEASGLRNELDAKETVREELEKQLADARSDLKVKSSEATTLRVQADKARDESNRNKEEVARLQQENGKLQLQAGRLQEVVRQKDEALASSDLVFGAGDNDLSGSSRSLVKSGVGLAKQCRELQSLLKKKSDDLSAVQSQNEVLAKKEESNRRLFKELTAQNSKSASAYIVSAVNARDGEILKLNSQVNSLQLELREIVQQRDELSSQLSRVLERRQQLDEMRVLVESMRQADNKNSLPPAANESDDDLEQHIHHHRGN